MKPFVICGGVPPRTLIRTTDHHSKHDSIGPVSLLSARMQSSGLELPSPTMSGVAFRHRCQWFRQASLTAECALVLPLFLMVCVIAFLFLGLIGQRSEKELQLLDRAKKTAAYGAPIAEEEWWIDLPSAVRMDVPFLPVRHDAVTLLVRARVRVWNGAHEGAFDSSGSDQTDDTLVYVTDHQSVYHTHADCTHLDLTVTKTDTAHVHTLRNKYGKRYKPCKGFPKGYTGTVYLTPQGDYYYPTPDYGSLIRHVHMAVLSDVEDLPVCTRCRQRDGAHAHREGGT